MLFIVIGTILFTTIPIHQTDGLKTTSPVSITLEGLTLKTWIEKSLWNATRSSIVHHLNEFCSKDYHCDAEYGVENIHLINAAQESPTAVRLNINADEPVSPSPVNFGNTSPFYNYTALLTGALVRAKIDLEQLYDNRSVHSPVHWHQNSVHDEPNRFLFVLLGIVLVGLIFGATVLFFQRIRRHTYSKLLKPDRLDAPARDELLTNSPSMSVSHP